MRVDGYIRVSDVAGRSGESFISVTEQRKAIEAYAAAHGLEIAEWHEDLNQSGGTLERPRFQAALERCRNGHTSGIIAAKLDRLTRSTVGLGTLIEEARTGGWNLIAVDFGLDLFAANGKLVADVLAAVAEWERTRRGDDWAMSRRNAFERGIPNGRVPIGYRKLKSGLPVIDRAQARKVAEAFELRAAGTPIAVIARRFRWSDSTTTQILRNESYVGVGRMGDLVDDKMYPPIVTRVTYDKVQGTRTLQPVPPGDTTRDRLLIGIAVCSACQRTLKVVRRKRADGSFVVSYYCKNAATEPCADRAFVHADDLDASIDRWFTKALTSVPRMVDVVSKARELEDAQGKLTETETELTAYVEQASALDPVLFRRGLEARQGRVTEAQEQVRHLSASVARLPAGGCLSRLWADYSALERRSVLAAFVDRVEVDRGASAQLRDHVRIFLIDGSLAVADIADDEERVRVAAA